MTESAAVEPISDQDRKAVLSADEDDWSDLNPKMIKFWIAKYESRLVQAEDRLRELEGALENPGTSELLDDTLFELMRELDQLGCPRPESFNALSIACTKADILLSKLREALEKIKKVPGQRKSSGHIHECAWCNGSADIARQALKGDGKS